VTRAGLDAGRDALRGEPAVVEFRATWGANCVAATPHLNEVSSEFLGIRFISITDEPASVVEPFLVKQPIRGWIGLDRAGATLEAYGVEVRPQTILVGRDGVVRGIMHAEQLDAGVLADGRRPGRRDSASMDRLRHGAEGGACGSRGSLVVPAK